MTFEDLIDSTSNFGAIHGKIVFRKADDIGLENVHTVKYGIERLVMCVGRYPIQVREIESKSVVRFRS